MIKSGFSKGILTVIGIASVMLYSSVGLAAAGEERIIHDEQTVADGAPEALNSQLQNALQQLGDDYVPRTVHWLANDEPAYLNRLILEDSPYLIQHAHNPVNWYPWGEDAFAKAKAEDKPIFLSIGYATCHWCHVMERESFEDVDIASILNEHFIAVKVDREQRPDVDSSYMSAVQIMTGRGGWPMSSFLTTDTKPFYGGTYYPPDVFADLLNQIVGVWRDGRDSIEAQAKELSDAVVANNQLAGDAAEIGTLVIDRAVADIVSSFDDLQGGFGAAPKFPQESKLFLLLDYVRRTGNEEAMEAAHFSLQRMAAGGIHDQVAGGFHRYAVDNDWLVPHFEKMLYNQALLARNYLEAYAISGDIEHRRTVTRLLDYVSREMTSSQGGFYSATDADSAGEEGTFFVWTPNELDATLNKDDAELIKSIMNTSDTGNFEGSNILHFSDSLAVIAEEMGVALEDLIDRLNGIKARLLDERQSREKPLLDDKIITAWNGMMITAFVEAGDALNQQEYIETALAAAEFIWNNNRRSSGDLWRVFYKDSASVNAAQEDYAYLAESFVRLYDATGNKQWLTRAESLTNTMHKLFWDGDQGGYFLGYETVGAVRPKDLYDSSIPTGNAVALRVLTQLWYRTGKDLYKQRADALLVAFSGYLQAFPSAFAYMLTSASELLSGEIGSRFYAARGNVKLEARIAGNDLNVDMHMAEGWHVNSNSPNQDYLIPTRLKDTAGNDVGATRYPDSSAKILGFSSGELSLFEGTARISVALSDLAVDSNNRLLPIVVQMQACDDTVCLPPEDVQLSVSLADL